MSNTERDTARMNAAILELAREMPDLRIRFKDESRLMKVIGWVLARVGMGAFMTDFTTTIGRSIYFPSRAWAAELEPWDVVAHEGVHARDDKRVGGLWFRFSYLFPLSLLPLALLSLGAIWGSSWWLVNLAWLGAAAPWPAPGRVHWERRAYLMTIVCTVIDSGPAFARSAQFQTWMCRLYTGPDYYRMAWRSSAVAAMVASDTERAIAIAQGAPTTTDLQPYARMAEILKEIR